MENKSGSQSKVHQFSLSLPTFRSPGHSIGEGDRRSRGHFEPIALLGDNSVKG